MPRDFVISGEALVTVFGGGALVDTDGNQTLQELGLAAEGIRVVPKYAHKEIHHDAFGPDIPGDIMTQLAEVSIYMTLIHYDTDILDFCMANATGGIHNDRPVFPEAGVLAPSGTLLGRGVPLTDPKNLLIRVGLQSPILLEPWRFLACYIDTQPLEIPLGTEKTLVKLRWRCIPYVPVMQPGSEEQVLAWSYRQLIDLMEAGLITQAEVTRCFILLQEGQQPPINFINPSKIYVPVDPDGLFVNLWDRIDEFEGEDEE